MSDGSQKLGVIAGGGDIPSLVVNAAREAGRDVLIIGIDGAYDESLTPHETVRIEQLGKCLEILKKNNCGEIVIIGSVTRPNLLNIKPAAGEKKLLKTILKDMWKRNLGDDLLLRHVIGFFEENGIAVVPPEQILGNILAPEGRLTKKTPSENNLEDIKKGRVVTEAVGQLDIGQCSVVCRGQVLAVEGPEGTDAMLQRVAGLPESLRGSVGNRDGVLVKLPKPEQDRRVDLPTLGLSTIENASEAGLAGIAFAAGGAHLVDAEACIKRANALNMFLIGLKF